MTRRNKKPDPYLERMRFLSDRINEANERRAQLKASGAHGTMRIDGLMSLDEFDRIEFEKRHRREQQ